MRGPREKGIFLEIPAGSICFGTCSEEMKGMRCKMITITKESTGNNYTMVGVVEARIVQNLDFDQQSDVIQLQRNKARDQVTDQMIHEAEKLGADAIVCVRYSSAPVENGATEVMAYGTAVKYKKLETSEK